MRIACLGPAGTYSQEAALKAFGSKHESVYCNSLFDVVWKVAHNQADGAVLPIENSTNGIVDLAVDALLQIDRLHEKIDVTGVANVLVRHQLYTSASKLQQIKKVYSHPQVWGQVRHWLTQNLPHAELVNASSTAEAVSSVLNSRNPEIAAFGGPLTTSCAPFIPNCADDPTNTTRFLVLRPKSAASPTSQGETKWAVATTNISDLHRQIASHRLEPRFIAARPSSLPWVYTYLVEFIGDPPLQWTLLSSHSPASRL